MEIIACSGAPTVESLPSPGAVCDDVRLAHLEAVLEQTGKLAVRTYWDNLAVERSPASLFHEIEVEVQN